MDCEQKNLNYISQAEDGKIRMIIPESTCVCCGRQVPEGWLVCAFCEKGDTVPLSQEKTEETGEVLREANASPRRSISRLKRLFGRRKTKKH